MSRMQGCNCDGELLSSAFVQKAEDYGVNFEGETSRTRQEFAEECDINALMARYEKSGVISHVNNTPGQFLDLGDASALDLMSAMNTLNAASDAFMSLPATIRAEFDNDAMSFVAFAEDASNIDKLREWGLAKPQDVEPPPQKVEVVGPNPFEGKASEEYVAAASARSPAKPA